MTSQSISSALSPQSSWLSQTQSFAMQTTAHLNSSFAHLSATKNEKKKNNEYVGNWFITELTGRRFCFGQSVYTPSSKSPNKNLSRKSPSQPCPQERDIYFRLLFWRKIIAYQTSLASRISGNVTKRLWLLNKFSLLRILGSELRTVREYARWC